MAASEPTSPTTRLLQRISEGDPEASEQLYRQLYGQLRDLARGILGPRRADGTLQATALVHEMWLRLGAGDGLRAESRRHFLRVAARAMRGVVVDHARARGALKRATTAERLPIDEALDAWESDGTLDPLVLDELLERLRGHDERSADVVELRFFGGLTEDEAAEALGLSARQVQHAWRLARGWLARELERGEERPA